MLKNPKVIERYAEEVQEKNEGFGKWEQIKKFELLEEEFSIENKEITPTLKLKRKVILDRYKDLIEQIYAG